MIVTLLRLSRRMLVFLPVVALLHAEPAEITSLRAKAEKGNAIAQYNLGLAYSQGRQDLPVNLTQAYVWLSLSGDGGSTRSAIALVLQRITDAKNKARDLGRPVQDGEMKTACQQSCPGEAISFGNIHDPKSVVRKDADSPRGYHVLDELNTRPSITYLTKIRNVEHV